MTYLNCAKTSATSTFFHLFLIHALVVASLTAEAMPTEKSAGQLAAEKSMTTRMERLESYKPKCEIIQRWSTTVQYFKVPRNEEGLRATLEKRALQLMLDENFVPYFGKPRDAFSWQEVGLFQSEILPSCITQLKNDVWAISYIFSGNKSIEYILKRSRTSINEQKRLQAELDKLPESDDARARVKIIEGEAQRLLSEAPGIDSQRFLSSLQAAEARLLVPIAHAEVEQLSKVGDKSGKLSGVELNKQLSNIRALMGKKATIDSKLSAVTQESEKAGLLDLSSQTQLASHKLLADLASRESADFQQFSGKLNPPFEALLQVAAREKYLEDTYADLLLTTEFSAFNEMRAKYRHQILSTQSEKLLDKIRNARHPSDTYAVLASLSDADKTTDVGKSLIQAQDKRLGELLPFRDLPGGLYLSAIYIKDIEAIKKGDNYYISGLRTAMINATNVERRDIMKEFEYYEKRNKNGGDIFDKLSMIEPVLMAYLLNYQNSSARCLRNGYLTMTITSTDPDIVTKNGFGMEVSRRRGQTSVKKYKINREFGKAFEELGKRDLIGLATGDLSINGGRIGELMKGTEELMKTYRCDDPKIQITEKHLFELYNARNP